MEFDALTKKGKGKNKGKSKTDGSKTSCFVCGRGGHMAKDCWFKDTSKGSAPNSKGKKGKGKGKGKSGCERSHNSDRIGTSPSRWELHQSNLENHPR